MIQLHILKENPARLLGDHFPEIMIDDRKTYDQEAEFEVLYKNRVIGRARLHYRIPFDAGQLRESQTFLVYGKPANWLQLTLSKTLQEGQYTSKTRLVYVLFRWIERDLSAFEYLFKQSWGAVVEENPAQHTMEISL